MDNLGADFIYHPSFVVDTKQKRRMEPAARLKALEDALSHAVRQWLHARMDTRRVYLLHQLFTAVAAVIQRLQEWAESARVETEAVLAASVAMNKAKTRVSEYLHVHQAIEYLVHQCNKLASCVLDCSTDNLTKAAKRVKGQTPVLSKYLDHAKMALLYMYDHVFFQLMGCATSGGRQKAASNAESLWRSVVALCQEPTWRARDWYNHEICIEDSELPACAAEAKLPELDETDTLLAMRDTLLSLSMSSWERGVIGDLFALIPCRMTYDSPAGQYLRATHKVLLSELKHLQ